MKIKNRQSSVTKKEFSNPLDPYGKKLSFYEIPPTGEVSLEDFEKNAIDRLRVLREIDSLQGRGAQPETFDKRMIEVLQKYLPDNNVEKDVISHFALRLAFCKEETDWFIRQERELLKLRLKRYGSLSTFVNENNLSYPVVDPDELLNLKSDLVALRKITHDEKPKDKKPFESLIYYKVPFTKVLDLVSQRKVLLVNGYAFVENNEILSLILSEFRSYLSHCLAVTKNHFPEFKQDTRVSALIEELPHQYLGKDYVLSDNKDIIDIEDLDYLSRRSMPPCMHYMHNTLRSKHHLKHFGRLSYNLFLKGIGVTLESVLEFWRDELERKGGRNFDKEFAYNIKHSYGTVGKRTSYSPYACRKIIDEPPVEGGAHGCPFKMDKALTRTILKEKEVSSEDIDNILKVANTNGQYQAACKCLFDALHRDNNQLDQSVEHPNQYFRWSTQYFKDRGEEKKNFATKAEKEMKEESK